MGDKAKVADARFRSTALVRYGLSVLSFGPKFDAPMTFMCNTSALLPSSVMDRKES